MGFFVAEGEQVREWVDFRTMGLHWMVNAAILNPRGYHMKLYYPDDTYSVSTGFQIVGDGSGPWSLPASDPDVISAFRRFQETVPCKR